MLKECFSFCEQQEKIDISHKLTDRKKADQDLNKYQGETSKTGELFQIA